MNTHTARYVRHLTTVAIDYDAFLTDDFDANQYVNSAINDPESSEAGDAATALAKLSFNVDSLEKQIKDQVTRACL